MRTIYNIALLVIATVCFSSCNDFLSKDPSKSSNVTPKTLDELETLLNDYAAFSIEQNYGAIFGSDSYGLKTEMYDSLSSTYNPATMVMPAIWDNQYLPYLGQDAFFANEYKKIFTANMIISNLDNVTGDSDKKKELELECRFIRAYSLWSLAQVYCLPYCEANLDEMGLTIKASTSFEESNARATMRDTYAFIEQDIITALELDKDLEMIGAKYASWRANNAAINGLAARFYLTTGDYAKARSYATTSLSNHDLLVDYNTEMRYRDVDYVVNGTVIDYTYLYDSYDPTYSMEWKELTYYRFTNYTSWWYVPSDELLNAYNQTYDLRFRYHIVDNYSIDRGHTAVFPGYLFIGQDEVPSGTTTAEMLLIKAECEAREGETDLAMATVNELRDVRMDASAPLSVRHLSASTAEEAVKLIIEERWREMPFSQRWNDIRRLNHNSDSFDNTGDVVRNFYNTTSTSIDNNTPATYTLKAGDRKYAYPIPDTNIEASNGVILQNIY